MYWSVLLHTDTCLLNADFTFLYNLQGSIKVIEEYRNSTKDDRRYNVPLECYYLFELNHDAACTDILSSSQLFITLIM